MYNSAESETSRNVVIPSQLKLEFINVYTPKEAEVVFMVSDQRTGINIGITKNSLSGVFDSCEREGARTLNQRLKRPLLYH